MKALIRQRRNQEQETVLESDNIDGIDWSTGAPLTNEDWCGGPYTLIDDYQPEEESSE